MVVVEERVQAEFNSAVIYLNRINEYFALCGEAQLSLNAYLWASTLTRVFIELSTKMKDDEKDKGYVRVIWLMDNTSGKKSRGSKVDRSLFDELAQFEMWLRKIFDDSGLEMKSRADASNILFKGGN